MISLLVTGARTRNYTVPIKSCFDGFFYLFEVQTKYIPYFLSVLTKALTKKEGPNVCSRCRKCRNARFLNPFLNVNQLQFACCKKKGLKNRASLQTLGLSYFVRALVIVTCG